MFKTAKNTLKKAAKDQVEFFLVLLTGLFAGSIFTLAYVKYDVKTTLSFADVGGMFAGAGTAGLLFVAIKTASSWKKQLKAENQINAIKEYSARHADSMLALQELQISKEFKQIKSSDLSHLIKKANVLPDNELIAFKELTVTQIDAVTKLTSILLSKKQSFDISRKDLEFFFTYKDPTKSGIDQLIIKLLTGWPENESFQDEFNKVRQNQNKILDSAYIQISHI